MVKFDCFVCFDVQCEVFEIEYCEILIVVFEKIVVGVLGLFDCSIDCCVCVVIVLIIDVLNEMGVDIVVMCDCLMIELFVFYCDFFVVCGLVSVSVVGEQKEVWLWFEWLKV